MKDRELRERIRNEENVMEKDKFETDVIFFNSKDHRSIIAYFPNENWNEDLYGTRYKVSYEHVGQHGSCDSEYVKDLDVASKEECADLREELESIGYHLNILEGL